MDRPLVSIIIPSYNQGRFLRETLDSTLQQDYRPIEVLVLDGASKDDSVDVLRSYGERPELQWWSEPDKGVVDAVNKGLARAKGAILAIQSSDDVYLPGAIATAVAAFHEDPALALVYGDCEYIDAASKPIGGTNLEPFDLAAYVGKRTFIPQPAAFFTKRAADAAGGWRPEISYAADAEFYLRVAAQGHVRKLDTRLARYRYHEAQRDQAGEKIAHDWEAAIRGWVEREHPPRALRRQARLGIHITRAHYLPESRWVRRTIELYRAALIAPTVVFRRDFPARELLPGRHPIWKALSRVKRALGFRPRGT